MKEFGILKLSFTVTNPGVNGPITLGRFGHGAALGPNLDTVVSFGQGRHLRHRRGLAGGSARSRSVQSNQDDVPEKSISARHW
jgi:hypothetical protein